ATLASQTERGMVMGTVGYMSPEQVKGQNADHRSDLFSFGAILYEMLSGKRAFSGETSVETMERDPETGSARAYGNQSHGASRAGADRAPLPGEESGRALPVGAGCGFQSGESLGDFRWQHGAAGFESAATIASMAIAAGSLLAGLIAGALLWPRREPDASPVFDRLTYQLGTVDSARFSPDGHTIVYSAAWEGRPLQLFSTRAEFPQPQPLGLERVRVGGVSASNEIALLLNPDAANPTLARAALSGGDPREVLEHVRDATWAPNGDLVIVRMANGRDRLEYPVGKMLYETAGWISHPRFSKKGDRIAFLDHTAFPDTRGTVALVDLSGHKQTLTREWEDVRGLAWSAAGDEIWFTASDNGTNDFLYAVTPSGRQRLVLSVPSRLFLQDIASDGRILLVAEDVRVRIAGHAAGATREQDLS